MTQTGLTTKTSQMGSKKERDEPTWQPRRVSGFNDPHDCGRPDDLEVSGGPDNPDVSCRPNDRWTRWPDKPNRPDDLVMSDRPNDLDERDRSND